MKPAILLAALLLVLSSLSAGTAAAETGRAKKVELYLMEAETAGRWLTPESEDLARLEAALAGGFDEIEAMTATYLPDARTNAFLARRGWGQLVWTQLMYRLLAIQNGIYDRELDFAAEVALEGPARGALQTVETSVARIGVLLQAKEKFGLNEQIDAFAQSLFQAEGTGYRDVVAAFDARFRERKVAVLARLESGRHPGIVDPAALPAGTLFAATLQEHRQRMAGENRTDEVFRQLADFDAGRVNELAVAAAAEATPEARRTAANEARVELLVLEDVLDASETDATVQELLALFETQGFRAFSPYDASDADFRDTMILVEEARRKLQATLSPAALRELYELGKQVR